MKKILVVGVSSIVGGIETFFHEVFKEKSKVFDITFLCFDKPCAFADVYVSAGYKVDVMPSRRSNPAFFSRNVKKYLKSHNDFDYVWINTSSTSIYQFQLYSKKYTKAKVITHSHGTKFEKSGNWLIHVANMILDTVNYKKVVSNTDLFFCCSRAAGIALFGYKKASELCVIHNGIDCNKFAYNQDFRNDIRKEFSIDDGALLVGVVGRLSLQKNPMKAIGIFKSVIEKRSDAKLLVVGAGDMLSKMQEEITALGLDGNVIIAGLRHDVNKIYSALDVLIMPSLFEGLPLTAVEAQCSGVHCVLSDTITKEVAITDLTSFLALDKADEKWAEIVLATTKKSERSQYSSLVKAKGYDSIGVKQTIESILV